MNIQLFKNIIILLFPFLYSVYSYANDSYEIHGEITFSEKGVVYIYLVDEKTFKTPLTGLKTIIIDPSKEEFASKKVSFEFVDINPGAYGIRCFQDQNNDGKLNKGLFGPSEPWGMSWNEGRVTKWPSFDKIAFNVASDIKNIKIELE